MKELLTLQACVHPLKVALHSHH